MKEESLRQSSLWMISGQSTALAAQAVYFVLIGRALGSGEYGAFVGVMALVTALAQFSSLGMENLLVRNVARHRSDFARAWGQTLAVSGGGFVALLGAAMLLAHFALPQELRALVPYLAVSEGLLGKGAQLAGRAFQGVGQLAWTARLTVYTALARLVAAAALFTAADAYGLHATALLWACIYWIATLAVALPALALVTLRLGWPKFGPIRGRDMSEGLSFSLSSSSLTIYNDIDKTILIGYGQTAAAGIYSAAYRVVDAASAPIYAIYTAATPRFFREGAGGVRQARAFARSTMRRTVPYSAVASVLLALAAPVVPMLFGASFRGSVTALRWLCLLPVLRALHYGWGTAITASASQWNRTAAQLGAAGLNLLLDFVLIPHWGWRGAAAASLLTDGSLAATTYLLLNLLARREGRARNLAVASR